VFRFATTLQSFIKHEATAGLLVMAAAALALLIDNSPLSRLYSDVLQTRVLLQVGAFALDKTVLLVINDALMAIFFLLVGLEIKREVLDGALSTRQTALLPAIAAVGGMVVPALIYAAINAGNPTALRGWAIPAATDIAFALGVLALLGSRVPASLKVFLLALAIIDDLGAIVIIALFSRPICRSRRLAQPRPASFYLSRSIAAVFSVLPLTWWLGCSCGCVS
jgi:Na+:H+ antiporter, NhaA family